MWANGHDLMDKILYAYDVVIPEALAGRKYRGMII